MSAPVLELDDLCVRLGGEPVVTQVTARFDAGCFIALVGPNGAGKSTLLRAIAGVIPAEGGVAYDGRPASKMSTSERARIVGYLPQGHQTHWPLPVREIVALGRFAHGAGDPRRLPAHDGAVVAEAMRRAGVTAFADRPATRLSGGEKARVALARVLAQEPRILLADEPTASLDPRYQIDVMALLKAVAASGTLAIAATHDLALAARFADRIWVLDAGRAATPAPAAAALSPDVLARVFRIRPGADLERRGLSHWDSLP